MLTSLAKKGLVILVIVLFFGTNALPGLAHNLDSISHKNILLKYDENSETNNKFKTQNIQLDFSTPQIISEDKFIRVIVKEADSYNTVPGEPLLPSYNTVMKFTLGTEIIDVKCVFSSFDTMQLSKKISPTPTPITNGILKKSLGNIINNELYDINKLYPSEWYNYRIGGGIDEKNHVTFLSINVYPLKYSPQNDQIQYVKKVNIEVNFKEPLNPLFPADTTYDLLVISPSEFVGSLEPLLEHKNNNGVLTTLVTIEEINGEGRDKQEQIKYFIKNAIEQWGITYVMLVGSISKLPTRQTWIGEFDVLTDLYYADIYFPNGSFSSWDTNGNGLFGEYWQDNDDIVDLYADVYIGRLASENKFEVQCVVNKIIKYEKSSYGKDWFNNIILCGGDTHPGYGVYEGEVTVKEIEKSMPDFTPIKLLTSDNTFTTSSLNKAINNGAGFFAYSGHGFEKGIGTHPPNKEEWIYYHTRHLLGAWNTNKLPIIFFDACLTARLDYTLGDLLKLPFINFPFPCFAWCFVKKPIGGAIAAIGATRVAFSMVDEEGIHGGAGYLSLHFFKNYEPGIRVGEMLVSSQNDYLKNLWIDPFTIEEFILLGDPSLMVGGYNE